MVVTPTTPSPSLSPRGSYPRRLMLNHLINCIMNVRITNLFTNCEVTLTDVKSIQTDVCELSLSFNEDHEYKSIEEIIDLLYPVVGAREYNYHFKGVDIYGNYYPNNDTDLLLVTSNQDIRYYIF